MAKLFGKKNDVEVVVTEEMKAEKKEKVKQTLIKVGKAIGFTVAGAICVVVALACAGQVDISKDSEDSTDDVVEGECTEVSEENSEE